MFIKRYFTNTRPGSSKRTKTQFIEECMISLVPLIKLKTTTEAYKLGRNKITHNLIISNDDIIEIERSTLVDLKKRSLGEISFIRHHYNISNNNMFLDIFDNIPGLMIVTVHFENEDDYNNFIPYEWFGEEISNDTYTNEYLMLTF